MPLDESIHIEAIDTIEACRQHVRLQDLVWERAEPDAVPVNLLIAAARHGGVVLGAYAGERMVGALLGLPALLDGRLIHLSHLLCVDPDFRGRGIGAALKWRQRELVLAQGIDTITWTYDPLGAANARLNLNRLGGTARTYVRDYYGLMGDQLNGDLPSDRFVLTWRLDAAGVEARARHGAVAPPVAASTADIPVVLGHARGAGDPPRPAQVVAPAGPAVLVEIPARWHEMVAGDRELALDWRLAARVAFERLFAAGYVATALLCRDGGVYYYLERVERGSE